MLTIQIRVTIAVNGFFVSCSSTGGGDRKFIARSERGLMRLVASLLKDALNEVPPAKPGPSGYVEEVN